MKMHQASGTAASIMRPQQPCEHVRIDVVPTLIVDATAHPSFSLKPADAGGGSGVAWPWPRRMSGRAGGRGGVAVAEVPGIYPFWYRSRRIAAHPVAIAANPGNVAMSPSP